MQNFTGNKGQIFRKPRPFYEQEDMVDIRSHCKKNNRYIFLIFSGGAQNGALNPFMTAMQGNLKQFKLIVLRCTSRI